jgi:hypothetical protein
MASNRATSGSSSSKPSPTHRPATAGNIKPTGFSISALLSPNKLNNNNHDHPSRTTLQQHRKPQQSWNKSTAHSRGEEDVDEWTTSSTSSPGDPVTPCCTDSAGINNELGSVRGRHLIESERISERSGSDDDESTRNSPVVTERHHVSRTQQQHVALKSSQGELSKSRSISIFTLSKTIMVVT